MEGKLVKLKKERPLLSEGREVWFNEDELFEVLEMEMLPAMGLGYKLWCDKYKMEIDGWNSSTDFEEVKE